jgi:hypothetical protein
MKGTHPARGSMMAMLDVLEGMFAIASVLGLLLFGLFTYSTLTGTSFGSGIPDGYEASLNMMFGTVLFVGLIGTMFKSWLKARG